MFEELKKILVEEMEVDAELITPQAEFINDLRLTYICNMLLNIFWNSPVFILIVKIKFDI